MWNMCRGEVATGGGWKGRAAEWAGLGTSSNTEKDGETWEFCRYVRKGLKLSWRDLGFYTRFQCCAFNNFALISLSILSSCLGIYRLLLNMVSFLAFDVIIKGMELRLSVLDCSYDLHLMHSLHSLQNVSGECGKLFFLVWRSFITLLKSQLREGGLLKHQLPVPNNLSFNTQHCAKTTKNEFLLIQMGPSFKAVFEMFQCLLS